MRDFILAEITRLAEQNGGQPPGKHLFSKATGISEAKWSGVLWARWSDALLDAGFTPNVLQPRLDSETMLRGLVDLARRLQRLPTRAEIKLERQLDPYFPSHGAVARHFPTQATLLAAIKTQAVALQYADLLAALPDVVEIADAKCVLNEGYVYLLISGNHYKIGRSDNIERRMREIKISMPEPVTLVHFIKTDDMAGIEAYWHRRFAQRRANGEWFRLTPDDVRVFKRRKMQ